MPASKKDVTFFYTCEYTAMQTERILCDVTAT